MMRMVNLLRFLMNTMLQMHLGFIYIDRVKEQNNEW